MCCKLQIPLNDYDMNGKVKDTSKTYTETR